MAVYLIAFNDEWTPDLSMDELRERGRAGRAVIEEMRAAGVTIVGGAKPRRRRAAARPVAGAA